MIRKSFFIGLLLVSSAFAECRYTLDTHKVEWTAFKTPKKVGVKGSFESTKLDMKASDSLTAVLRSAKVFIATDSVNSSHEGRDALLLNDFFHVQGVRGISVAVLEADKKKIVANVTMQQKTHKVTFDYTVIDGNLYAKGKIDLKDFGMLPSLEAINKACYDLHEGKTWQDVEIAFSAVIKKECK